MSQQEHTLMRSESSLALIANDRNGYNNRVNLKQKAELDTNRLNEMESELLNMKKQLAQLTRR